MANLNKVMLIGNLTQDPDAREMPSGKKIVTLTVATNRNEKDASGNWQMKTTYLYVKCLGKTGELAVQYLHKGRPVFIEGRLDMQQWQDKATGQQRTRLDIVAENMQFLGGGAGTPTGQQGNRQQGYNRQQNTHEQQKANGYQQQGYSQGEADEDIPF